MIPVKNEIAASKVDTPVLMTVLLNGYHFFKVVGSCKPVTIELAKLSAVSIWRQSCRVRTLDLDYLRVKQTNLQEKNCQRFS